MYVEILREQQRLDGLFDTAKRLVDDEIKAHLTKYLCVLVSAFLENAMRTIVLKYVGTRSHRHVLNFVNSRVSSLTNLNEERLRQLLGAFSGDWRIKFESDISDEQKVALDSVVNLKNCVAHGKPTDVSFVRINNYYQNIRKVVELVQEICV
jgi:hypothetical protein